MQICRDCEKAPDCRVPQDFDRFKRVHHHLEEIGAGEALRQRLNAFLHINHCIADGGELDLIHHLMADHAPDHLSMEHPGANAWGIPDDIRERMLEMRRHPG